MTKSVRRWAIVVALAAAAVGVAPTSRVATAQSPAPPAQQQQQQPAQQQQQQVATVEQLKLDAFSALKRGNFPQSYELLQRAADMSKDPSDQQMSQWLKQFESQRQEFAAERHKQYEKAVGQVKKLIDNKYEGYALDAAARASL